MIWKSFLCNVECVLSCLGPLGLFLKGKKSWFTGNYSKLIFFFANRLVPKELAWHGDNSDHNTGLQMWHYNRFFVQIFFSTWGPFLVILWTYLYLLSQGHFEQIPKSQTHVINLRDVSRPLDKSCGWELVAVPDS